MTEPTPSPAAEKVRRAKAAEDEHRGRSPSYPGITLEEAVRRVRMLASWLISEQLSLSETVPIDKASAAWGFQNRSSGPAAVARAAIRRYGLVNETGRSATEPAVTLTALGMGAISSTGRATALRRAALRPTINRRLWTEFDHSVPPHDDLVFALIHGHGFSQTGGEECARIYRQTMIYADLWSEDADDQVAAGGIPHDNEFADQLWSVEREGRVGANPSVRRGWEPAPSERHGLRMPLRLAGGELVYLEGEFPIAEEAYENLLQILAAMRPGLVRPNDQIIHAGGIPSP